MTSRMSLIPLVAALKSIKFAAGAVRNDARQRGLSHARWSSENHRGYLVSLDELSQHLILSEQMRLPEKILQ